MLKRMFCQDCKGSGTEFNDSPEPCYTCLGELYVELDVHEDSPAFTERTKIGYSVSQCVRDIVECNPPITQVSVIFGGTFARNLDEWELLHEGYCDYAWQGIEREAREVLFRLLEEGRILQWRAGDCTHQPQGRRWRDTNAGTQDRDGL